MPFRLVISPILLGTTNFTIFTSFCSFPSFRSIQLCRLDFLFHPFFWGQRILLFFAVFAIFAVFAVFVVFAVFAVFVIFAVFGYALQTCCFTHFSGDTNFTIFPSFCNFRSFRSFCNFRSIWLCPSDLLFHPFFWGQRILLLFAVTEGMQAVLIVLVQLLLMYFVISRTSIKKCIIFTT